MHGRTQFGCPVIALLDHLRPGVLLPGGVTQRFGDVTDRRLGTVGDDVGDLGGVLAVVALVDVLDGLLPPVGLDVQVDIGRPVTIRGQKALEQQAVTHCVDRGDADREADCGIGRAAPALAQNAAALAELHDLPDDQKVAGKVQRLDDRQLVLDLGVGVDEAFALCPPSRLVGRAVALARPDQRQLAQIRHLGVPGRDRKRRKVRRDELELEGQLVGQLGRALDRAGPAGEPVSHLLAAAQMRTGPRRQPALQVVQGAAGANRGHRHGQRSILRGGVVGGRGRDDGQAGFAGEAVQGVVEVVGDRVHAVGELDDDVVVSEPIDQLGQGAAAGVEGEGAVPGTRQRGPDTALTAAGEHQPVAGGSVGQLVDVIDGPPLGAAAHLSGTDRPGQRGIPGGVAGQRQQMLLRRVGHADARGDHPLGLVAGNAHAEGQFGAEHGGQTQRLRGLGEADDAVEAVVVGQSKRGEAQPDSFLGHLFGGVGAVEEAERAVCVQLGEAHRAGWSVPHSRRGRRGRRGRRWFVGVALTRPGGGVAAVTDAGHRQPGQMSLQLPPRNRRVTETHVYSIEHVFAEVNRPAEWSSGYNGTLFNTWGSGARNRYGFVTRTLQRNPAR